MSDRSGGEASGVSTLDTALLDAKAEVAVVVAAGGVGEDRAEQALASSGIELTLVNIRLAESEPRPVMKARFELTYARTGEGRIVEMFVSVPSAQPAAQEVEQAKVAARQRVLHQLLGPAAVEERRRSRQPTVELPEIIE